MTTCLLILAYFFSNKIDPLLFKLGLFTPHILLYVGLFLEISRFSVGLLCLGSQVDLAWHGAGPAPLLILSVALSPEPVLPSHPDLIPILNFWHLR